VSQDSKLIAAHLSYHAMRLVSELVAKHLLTRHLHVFLTLASFERCGADIRLDVSTNSLKRITTAVRTGFLTIYRADEQYRGCGVVATRISEEARATGDLFGLMNADKRQAELMLTVNRINKRYGERTVQPASVQSVKLKRNLPRFQYPLLIAR